jgi:hypothetical protein
VTSSRGTLAPAIKKHNAVAAHSIPSVERRQSGVLEVDSKFGFRSLPLSIPPVLNRRKGGGHDPSLDLARNDTEEVPMPTRKYLVFLRSVPGKQEPRHSPAQMQEMYAAFGAWKEKFKANIVDMGGKLQPGGRTLTAAGVTDGPFAEAKEVVGGFMVVAAENYERAIEVVRECPGVVRPGSSVEIREIASP